MAVKTYIAIVGSLAVGAACAAPLARLSQTLLQTASELHVATGWGPGSGQLAVAPRVWSPSWEWRTFAAFTVPLDGAATYHARLYLAVTAGDVRVRLGPNGAPLTVTATGVIEIEGEAIPIGGGLAVIELQIQSELVGSTSTASVVWSDTGYALLPGDPGYAREFFDGQDRHVIPGPGFAAGGGWAVVPWPARRRTDSDRTYTVQALTFASVLGLHVWGESDGMAIPTQPGDVRILRGQDFAHRSAAASLLARTPYVQTVSLGALSLDGRDQWGRVVDISAGAEVVAPLPVDEQGTYALRMPLVHDQLADVDVEVRAYVDGVLIQTTTHTIPPLTPDSGDGGSYLRWRLQFPTAAVADAWRESTADIPAVETTVQVTTPGLLSVEIEAAATVLVLPPTLIPARPAPVVSPLPTGTRVQSLLDYLTAPDLPWGTLRREIASWQDLGMTAGAAAGIYEASPVPVVRVRVDAVLTDCVLEVELIESDGVTSAGTILLDATSETGLLMDGSIDVVGGDWYYVRVDTTEGTTGSTAGIRLYEEKIVIPTSVVYADRATLLAATPINGSVGFVADYDPLDEAWLRVDGSWALLTVRWDGETAGQRYEDLPAGVEGATATLGRSRYRYATIPTGGDVTAWATYSLWIPDDVYERTPVLLGVLNGDEADTAQVEAQGLEEQTSGTGAVVYGGTEIQCTVDAASSAAVSRIGLPDAQVPAGLWMSALVRGDIGSNRFFVAGHVKSGRRQWVGVTTTTQTLRPFANGNISAGSTAVLQQSATNQTLPAVAGSPVRIEYIRLESERGEIRVGHTWYAAGSGETASGDVATCGISKSASSGAADCRISQLIFVGYTL